MIPPQATKVLNIFLIVIPITYFAVLIGHLVGQWRQIGPLRAEQLGIERQISVVDHALSTSSGMPSYKQRPTAEQSAAEQAQFLDQLQSEAKATRIQIMTWTNAVIAANPDATANSASNHGPAEAHALPAGINPIASQVEVEGTFQDLRQFLYHLERTPRLLNLSNPHWVRSVWPQTHLSFMLTRYVTLEATPIQTTVGQAL